jgi:hypothetical protein
MKRSTILCACLFLAPATLASAQGPALLGTWEATTRSYGGIGSSLEFRADSTVVETMGAMIDGTYRVEGTTLTLTFQDPTGGPAGPAISFSLDFRTDTLVRLGPGPTDELRMTRVAAFPEWAATPIVGTWTYRHPTGVAAFETYTPDGVVQLRVPVETDRGTYHVAGDSLTLRFEAKEPQTVGYTIGGVFLILFMPGGEQYYKRSR